MTIALIYIILNKNIQISNTNKIYLDKLENLLFTAIGNYIQAISFYKENYLNFNLDNIKLDFPYDNLSSVNINENKSLSLTLLFSNVAISYNPEIKSLTDNSSLKNKNINRNYSTLSRKYSTLVSSRNQKRNFTTSIIRSDNSLLKNMQDNKELNNIKPKDINYNKSIFSLLDQIRELTKNKSYDPKEVQLKIENFWYDILKERYSDNVYNCIKDIQPKIYEIFVTKDPNSLRYIFPDLYLFLDDIKVYLITYSIITTYFRRSSRTAICSLVADQVLYYIYQTYFYPIIKGGDKGIKNIKIKKSKSNKEYDKSDIFNSLTKNKKDKLLKLIEVSRFKKEDFNDNSKLNRKDNEQLISSIIFILERILI
jgi:hypothetical protein